MRWALFLALALLPAPGRAGEHDCGAAEAATLGSGTLPSGVLVPVGNLTTPGPIAWNLIPSTAANTSVSNNFTTDQGINRASPRGMLDVVSNKDQTSNVVIISSQNLAALLALLGNGYVGISTGIPQTKLQIVGTNVSGIGQLQILDSGNSVAQLSFWGTGGSAEAQIYKDITNAALFIVPASQQPLIVQAGRLGLGPTLGAAGANARLHVSSTPTNAVAVFDGTQSAGGSGVLVRITAEEDDFTLLVSSPNGTAMMGVRGDGRVGIGTAGPQTTLDVNGSLQVGSGATKSTTTEAGLHQSVNGTASAPSYSFGSATGMGMYSDGTNLLFSLSGNRVGTFVTGGFCAEDSGSGDGCLYARSDTQPSHSTNGDLNTGMDLPTGDILRLVTGGRAGFQMNTSSLSVVGAQGLAAHAPLVGISSNTGTILFEVLNSGIVNNGCIADATLRTTTPPSHGAANINTVLGCTTFDLFTSTGTSQGQWRNSRTGAGP